MGTKRRYSITKDKRRFNDDKYLNFQRNNGIVFNKSLKQINRYFDWSISWFDLLKERNNDGSFSGDNPVLFNGEWISGQINSDTAWFIGYIASSAAGVFSKINIILKNGGTVAEYSLNTNYTALIQDYDLLKHFVLNWDSTQNLMSLYVDGVKTDSVIINNDFQGVEKHSRIADNYDVRWRKGGLRDISVFNKQLSQSEINYIYNTGVLPQSTHENCYYHFPLNSSIYNRPNAYECISLRANWDSGLILKDKVGTNGSCQFKVFSTDANENAFFIGLSTLSKPVTNWDFGNLNYGIYVNFNGNDYNKYTGSTNNGVVASPQTDGDIFLFDKVGTNLDVYLNGNPTPIASWTGVTEPLLTPTILSYNNSYQSGTLRDNFKLVELPILVDGNPSYDIEDVRDVTSVENNSVEKNYDYDKNVISISSRDRNGVFDITFNDSITNDMQCTVGVVGDLINGSPIDDKELQYGLYDTTNITNSTNIQYGFHVGSGTGNVFFATNGVLVDSGIPYVFNTTTIKVERVNTTIYRYINGSLVDTVINVTGDLYPGYSLLKDEPTTPYFINNTINGIKNYYHLNYNSIQYYNDGIYSQELPSVIDNARHLYAGWTDDELLITQDAIGIIPNNAFKNFYSKKSSDTFAPAMDGRWSDTNNYMYWRVPTLTEDFTTNGWSIVMEGDFTPFGDGNNGQPDPFFNTTGNYATLEITKSLNNITWQMPRFNTVLSYPTHESPKSVVITFATNGDIKMYLNGILVDTNNITFSGLPLSNNLFGVTGGGRFFKYFEGIYIFDKVLIDSEVSLSYKEPQKWLDLSPVVGYGNRFNGSQLIDLTGNYGDTTKGGDSVTTEHIVDTNSMFEPRKKGLQFNGTSQYLDLPTLSLQNNNGLTFVIVVEKNDNNDFTSFGTIFSKGESPFDFNNFVEIRQSVGSGGGNPKRFYEFVFPFISTGLNPIYTNQFNNTDLSKPTLLTYKYASNGNKDVIVPYDINNQSASASFNTAIDNSLQINVGNGYDLDAQITPSGGVNIGRRVGGGFPYQDKILYFAIFNGHLNDAEVKELYNNGLFSNPSTTLQEKYDLELFVDFNNPNAVGINGEFDDTQFSDDFNNSSADISFPDLSPNNHTIRAIGWNDLSDLQNSLVDL